jgi:probable addiction module antidote protein
MSKPYDFNPAGFRDNPIEIARHLTEAFETNDLGVVVLAINSVMRNQNVVALAKKTGLRRDLLYKTFGGDVNPQLGRVMELLAGMDVQLVVKPLRPKIRAPKPKLGRAPKADTKNMLTTVGRLDRPMGADVLARIDVYQPEPRS